MSCQESEKKGGLARRMAAPFQVVAMTALILLLGSAGRTHSQWPSGAATKSPLAILAELKTANDDLLKKQQSTLDRLDALQKEADQLRIFSAQH